MAVPDQQILCLLWSPFLKRQKEGIYQDICHNHIPVHLLAPLKIMTSDVALYLLPLSYNGYCWGLIRQRRV